mmetsp:Transcript_10537/g.15714  ORF Transcript_10537/g.15714 Transcript_10537/m.15714 type:complete len:419 (+) Transcript_10537:178-1434(+)
MPSQKKVGKYVLGKTLGEGTFGKVKLAENTETGKFVAIKVLDKERIQQQNMGIQIKREVSIMKVVKNPHVVQLHEVLASKTKIYLVLELVTGGELFDEIVRETKFSEDKARYYFRQLVSGVQYCHEKGVCHRDLKPENLLLDENHNLKISDFGLSALYTDCNEGNDEGMPSRATLLHTTCGTPNYVAPEVLDDEGYDGCRADTWSMGVILYVLVAGYLPFDEPTVTQLFEKIQNADYLLPPSVSPELQDLLGMMLVAEPCNRASLNDIKDHEWMKMDINPTCLGTMTAEADGQIIIHNKNKEVNSVGQNSIRTSWISRSTPLVCNAKGEAHIISREIRSTLEEMCCEISRTDSMNKLKALRNTPKGLIGIMFSIEETENDDSCRVEIRRGKGDIMEYNSFLNELLQEKLNCIISALSV